MSLVLVAAVCSQRLQFANRGLSRRLVNDASLLPTVVPGDSLGNTRHRLANGSLDCPIAPDPCLDHEGIRLAPPGDTDEQSEDDKVAATGEHHSILYDAAGASNEILNLAWKLDAT